MWAETDFVGSIIKLRTGLPLYGSPLDSNSFVYTPGSPILTFLIATVVHGTGSLTVLRTIQLGYVVCAVVLAFSCTATLQRLSFPSFRNQMPLAWAILTFLVLALAATSPQVNRFVHCLHADALALLFSIGAFWLLLQYLRRPSWTSLAMLALMPAAGFFIKQTLIAWFGVIAVVLLVGYGRRGLVHTGVFLLSAATMLVGTIAVCYWLWGSNFGFWVFGVMGGSRRHISLKDADNIAIARCVDHVFRAWPELMIGIVGWRLIQCKRPSQPVAALWLGWIALVSSEALFSGSNVGVLYYFGPAVLIGTVALLAALPVYWPAINQLAQIEPRGLSAVGGALVGAVSVVTVIVALRSMPTLDRTSARWIGPQPGYESYRQVAEIEHEMDGIEPAKVLVDIGNWVYLRSDYLAKDRAVSLADQPIAGMYQNFEPLLRRISAREYKKILVRDFHGGPFLYDWPYWRRSSGVYRALVENYTEIRSIPSMNEDRTAPPMIMFSGAVTVLVPKTSDQANDR